MKQFVDVFSCVSFHDTVYMCECLWSVRYLSLYIHILVADRYFFKADVALVKLLLCGCVCVRGTGRKVQLSLSSLLIVADCF